MRRLSLRRTSTVCLLSLVVGAGACAEDPSIAALPVADAGFDMTVRPGNEVTLDGSQSHDPGEADLEFSWELMSTPDVNFPDLIARTTEKPRFTPDEPGDYIVALEVGNGRRWSLPDVVAIHAVDNAVVAEAQCVVACEVFHGTAGSVDGRLSYGGTGASFSYTWTQITSTSDCAAACPGITACDPITVDVAWTADDAAIGRFTAPCALGTLVFELRVTDGNTTGTDCVSVASLNRAPVARVTMSGPNIIFGTLPKINDTEPFSLEGVESTDDDTACDPTSSLTYAWTQTSLTFPLAVIVTADQDVTAVTAPNVTADTTYEFQLVVSDGIDESENPCTTFSSSGDCGARIRVLDANP
ncbi:MAG: PKD domain-containing protein [Myxococcota bacterium]